MIKQKSFRSLILHNFGIILLFELCFVNITSSLLLKETNFEHRQDSLKADRSNSATMIGSNLTLKYQVFRIVPRNGDELVILNNLYKMSSELQLDFWKAPTNVGLFADVMVNPEYLNETREFLDENSIEYTVIIDDVERLIMQREKSQVKAPGMSSSIFANNDLTSNPLLMSFYSKRMKDDAYISRNKAKYAFGDYHSYNDMLKWMSEIESYYPNMARVFTIGTTHEGRPIRGIRIGNPITDTSKRAVWIDGGMHAREWAAIHTALYFIEQLISLYGVDSKITSYVDNLNFYFVPVANPDGFEYSRSDVTPQTRFWRKNRGMQVCKKDRWRRERCCSGVDLNRNFDFHWGAKLISTKPYLKNWEKNEVLEIGSSEDLCSDIFQGTGAFSEPESRAIRDKLLSAELNGKLDAFITLHTYSQMWIHPYNHERKSFPDDIKELQLIGKQGVEAIEGVYGTKFRFGTGADILYPSAGGSDDWAKAHAHVKFVYLLELRPGEDEWDGFLLDRRQLLPTGRETWEGVKVVIDAVLKKVQQRPRVAFTQPFVAVTSTFAPPPITTMSTFAPRSLFTTIGIANRFVSQPQVQTQTQRQVQRFDTTVLNTNSNMNNNNNNNVNVNRRIDPGFLRNSMHDRLARLRENQVQARLDYEQKLQQAEQQRQLIFWQNQQNRLHSGCSDRSPWCANWIRVAPQICRTSTVYMRQDCRSTCGFCSQQQRRQK